MCIGKQARRQGMLSLEPIVSQIADPYIRDAVSLAVDAIEPDLVRDILETRLDRAIIPSNRPKR
jgi:chemotaxis protein MotA